jgi:two-component system response regulator FixJ
VHYPTVVPDDGIVGADRSMPTATVYIVDDEPAVKYALHELLSVLGYAVESFDSAYQFLEALDPMRLGCLVADVRMPGMDGLELLKELSRRSIPLPAVLISGYAEIKIAIAAIRAGAEDFLEKPLDDGRLTSAIGACFVKSLEERARERSRAALERRLQALTPREVSVFDLVAQGWTSRAIGMRLGVSARTVEADRIQVMKKMQATNVAALVRQAIRLHRFEP